MADLGMGGMWGAGGSVVTLGRVGAKSILDAAEPVASVRASEAAPPIAELEMTDSAAPAAEVP
jgi:hypothetical protein